MSPRDLDDRGGYGSWQFLSLWSCNFSNWRSDREGEVALSMNPDRVWLIDWIGCEITEGFRFSVCAIVGEKQVVGCRILMPGWPRDDRMLDSTDSIHS